MMKCDYVLDQLDAYELGALDAPAREAVEAHLASCAGCREALARVRSADAALRAALAWAEPSEAFAGRVTRLARRSVVLRRASALAAVAAVLLLGLCGLLLHGARPSSDGRASTPPEPRAAEGQLLAGEVYDTYGVPAQRLVPGRVYAACVPAALSVDPGSLLVMDTGSQFAPAAATGKGRADVSVLAGSLVGQVGPRAAEVAIELAPELGGAIVRTKGCEFYSSGFPAERLAAGTPFPAGALAHWPGEIRVHVYKGHLDLDLGTQRLALAPGDSALIAGGVSAGTARSIEAHIRELANALGEATIRKRHFYRQLREEYARRLFELRAMERRGEEALPYLRERIELVEGLLNSHAATLARVEAAHPEVFELDAALAELHRLDLLDEEAHGALERYLDLLASAG